MKTKNTLLIFSFFFLSGCIRFFTPIPTPTQIESTATFIPSPTNTFFATFTPEPTAWSVTPIVIPIANAMPTDNSDTLPQADLSEEQLKNLGKVIASNAPSLEFAYNLWLKKPFPSSEIGLFPVDLSSGKLGLMYHSAYQTGGSSISPIITNSLYIVESNNIRQVWNWQHFGGHKAGLDYQMWRILYVKLEHLTNNSLYDVILEKQGRGRDFYNDQINYLVHFPGKLVFSWNGDIYSLSHYYDGNKLFPIHPVTDVQIAPEMHLPLLLDGESNDWDQIEYIQTGTSWDKREEEWKDYPLGHTISWDEKYIYIFASTPLDSTIQVALDTDLHHDFDSKTIDEDDFVFEFHLSGKECKVEFEVVSDNSKNMKLFSHSKTKYYANDVRCKLEIAIPRNNLHLEQRLIASSGTIKRYLLDEYRSPINEYHLASGQIIGLAIQLKEYAPKYDMKDPTTWGTLIFASDR